MMREFWGGKRVFITGHTGFKGGWLALWLHQLGACVHGFALVPSTDPNLFEIGDVNRCLTSHTIGDITDSGALSQAMRSASPDVVFHLAAQPLVRRSYADPVETFAVNVLGTVNLLEAARASDTVRVIVNVTTDKCYENREWPWAYREGEALGGRDPYSSSKACSELVTQAYRQSFLARQGVAVATARAGNVIGGGDWAEDRLLPDFFRAVDAGTPLDVRHPQATRPWQHVLEPLAGYLTLAEALFGKRATDYAGAWNFGPSDDGVRSVRSILDYLSNRIPGAGWRHAEAEHVHEATLLKLDSSRANASLGWSPRWRLGEALDRTVEWHQAWRAGADMHAMSLSQIAAHGAPQAAISPLP